LTDVLFANVPLLKTCINGLCPSLTFLQLGTWLESQGYSVVLQDLSAERDLDGEDMDAVVAEIARQIVAERPRVLGLSTKVPADGRFTRDVTRLVKAELPDVAIVIGGIWATPCYAEILETIPEVDVVVLGEGERAMAAITERVLRGLPAGGEDVPGAAFRGAAGIRVTPSAPPLTPEEHPPLDLGLMPCPDRYTVFPYLTSTGCPYGCTFCVEHVIFPRYVEKPLPRIREDLERLDAFGRDYFLWLSDPLFGADAARLEGICEILKDTSFEFLVESRVDVLRPEQLPLVWEAGCELIYFGLESASFSTLRRLGKLRTEQAHVRYLEQARALMAACTEADVTPVFGVIVPAPGDTPDDVEQTVDFMIELAEIARTTARATGSDPGFHFYAFPYRFIRGAAAFEGLAALAESGGTWQNDPDDVLQDISIVDASSEVTAAVAFEAARKIRELVHTTPTGLERLRRSFPPQPLGGLG